MVPLGLVLLAVAILVARALRESPGLAEFFARYDGTTELPAGAPVGFPAWLGWQHFLNSFFLLFIVRSALLIRGRQRPPAFVTRDNDGPLRTKRAPRRLSIHVWWHLVVDTLWVANGVVYVVLLFASGQWMRIVPLSWDVVPDAVSAGIQYLSLDWPAHDGWVHYNALQLLSYFATVFVAGPLALLTGLRLSPVWRHEWRVNRVLTEGLARATHFWVLVYFLAFTVLHVGLVLTTGALRNLNTMYAGRHDDSWIGALVFAGSLVVMLVGWVVLRVPVQKRIARLGNTVR